MQRDARPVNLAQARALRQQALVIRRCEMDAARAMSIAGLDEGMPLLVSVARLILRWQSARRRLLAWLRPASINNARKG